MFSILGIVILTLGIHSVLGYLDSAILPAITLTLDIVWPQRTHTMRFRLEISESEALGHHGILMFRVRNFCKKPAPSPKAESPCCRHVHAELALEPSVHYKLLTLILTKARATVHK